MHVISPHLYSTSARLSSSVTCLAKLCFKDMCFTDGYVSMQVLAAPFAAGALFLPYPWCFLTLIPSNVIGEMWIGVTTAIVVDLAPTKIRTAAIALYLFIITIIGGNFNLLVPPLKSAFQHSFSELASYRWALFITFPGVYAFSSLLFLLAFFLMRLDLKRKQMLEETMIVNQLPEDKDDDEPEGKAV